MGSPIYEVRRRREAGDHPAGRAVVVIGAAHPGPARHPTVHLLLLVRSLSKPRRGRPRGSHPGAAAGGAPTPPGRYPTRTPSPAPGVGRIPPRVAACFG